MLPQRPTTAAGQALTMSGAGPGEGLLNREHQLMVRRFRALSIVRINFDIIRLNDCR
jgi:hypothetical protein